jgi:hypothetical protein
MTFENRIFGKELSPFINGLRYSWVNGLLME